MEVSFDRRVEAVVRSIPKGSVLSYGEVATRVGRPRAARAVVGALRRLQGIPWWRVVRSDRSLAPAVAEDQARLLRQEGVRVEGGRILSSPRDGGPRTG